MSEPRVLGGESGVQWHPLLVAMARALERERVCWGMLRLPSDPLAPSGDVDLLVDPGHSRTVFRTIQALGFAMLPGKGYGSDTFFVAYHHPTDHWIWLHVASELSFGPYGELRVDVARECLARRRPGDIPVLSDDDAFWVLLLHCLLDKGSIASKHRSWLQQMAPSANGGTVLAAIDALLSQGRKSQHILDLTHDGNWDSIERFAPRLLATWRQRQPRSHLRAILNRLQRTLSRPVVVTHPVVRRHFLWSRNL